MSVKRRRVSKKEYKRLVRERAEDEAKARSESDYRQGRIKLLWQELQKNPDHAKQLAKDDTGATLLELVGLQRDEIRHMRPGHQLYEWAEVNAPKELAALRDKHPVMTALRVVLARAAKLASQQAYDRATRSKRLRDDVGLIEYEFGGQAESRAGFPCDPDCLDNILHGYGVTMADLEILFGMERHRFPKKLPSVRDRRKILYSALAVVKIMDALLGEKPRERKRGARGGSMKKVWLSNPDCRKRVLMGIASRAYTFSSYRDILAAFMAVVCRHLAIGYPKEQLPEGFEHWLARLTRRYLD